MTLRATVAELRARGLVPEPLLTAAEEARESTKATAMAGCRPVAAGATASLPPHLAKWTPALKAMADGAVPAARGAGEAPEERWCACGDALDPMFDGPGPRCIRCVEMTAPRPSPRGLVPEPLAHVSPDAEAARQMAARLQRALDEERRRGHALAEAVRATVETPGTAVGAGPALLLSAALAAYEGCPWFAEYDEPAREGGAA